MTILNFGTLRELFNIKKVYAEAQSGGGTGGPGGDSGTGVGSQPGEPGSATDPAGVGAGDPSINDGTAGSASSGATSPGGSQEVEASGDIPDTASQDSDSNGRVPPSEPDFSSSPIACTPEGSTLLSWFETGHTAYYNLWNNSPTSLTADRGLLGQYFDDQGLMLPFVTRLDPVQNNPNAPFSFNWGLGSPIPDIISPDTFSVRWTGKIKTPNYSGEYTFKVISEGGVSLWVNDEKIISQSGKTNVNQSQKIDLEANKYYNIRFEYNNKKDEASVSLMWSYGSVLNQVIPKSVLYPSFSNYSNYSLLRTGITLPSKPLFYNDGLFAQYWEDTNKIPSTDGTGKNSDVFRVDPRIDFVWNSATPPDNRVNPESFAVRWKGKIKPLYDGKYTVSVNGKDGIRLFIGDRAESSSELINSWKESPERKESAEVTLIANQSYDILLEHFHKGGSENFQLLWSRPGSAEEEESVIAQESLYRTNSTDLVQGLYTQYYDNNELRGVAVGSVVELNQPGQMFDYPWGISSPYPGVQADDFSVRWYGVIKPPSDGNYTFYLTTLGNTTVQLDKETSFLEASNTTTPTTKTASIELDGNQYYTFMVESKHKKGSSELKLEWSKADTTTGPNGGPAFSRTLIPSSAFFTTPFLIPTNQYQNTLFSRIYDNRKLNSLVTSSNELYPDTLLWPANLPSPSPEGNISPNQYVEPDHYSVKWTGKIKVPQNGDYVFYINADDGVNLYVDKRTIINTWNKNGPTTTNKSGDIKNLVAGKTYDFRLEFYEYTDISSLKLQWKTPGMGRDEAPVDIPYEYFSYAVSNSDNILTVADNPPPGSLYYYQIQSVGPGGITPSDWLVVPGGNCAVSTPSSINASCQPPPDQDNIRIEVNWNDVLTASEYHVYRKSLTDGVEGPLEDRGYVSDPAGSTAITHQMIDTLDANTLDPASDTRYFYAVKVIDQTGRGNEGAILPSDWVEVNLPDCSPPVINLSLKNNTTGITQQQNDLPLVAKQNEPVSISWNTVNVPIGADSCTASIPSVNPAPSQSLITAWSNGKAQAGTQNLPPISAIGDYQFRLTCSNPQGASNFSTITLRVTQTQKPYIQTTGGDVHTNESIFIPGDAP